MWRTAMLKHGSHVMALSLNQVSASQPPPAHPSFRRLAGASLTVMQQRASSTAGSAVEELSRDLTNLRLEQCVSSNTFEREASRTWHEQLQRPGLLSGCEPQRAPLRVAVLLSGGVDSSLALKLLLASGHRVTAFYLQIWFQEDFANFWDACPWEDDLRVCQQVCEEAGVQLHVVPLTKQYWDLVVSTAVQEIKAGHTPNPDMLCNSRVKFGAFYDYLESNHRSEFDRVASGHYAALHRPADDSTGAVQLGLSGDSWKDQTYFLATLSQEQLAKTMFPLAALTKAEVRDLAASAQLPNRQRPDSQGICFLGHVRFSEFVKLQLGVWPGLLVEEETNEIVGTHEGMWLYTPGQRKGIMLSGGPWYVTRKNTSTNSVYISRQYHDGTLLRDTFWCNHFSWSDGERARAHPRTHAHTEHLQCKVRHGPHIYEAEVMWESGGQRAQVRLNGNDQGLAAGQYAVFYRDGICLGCGVICAAPNTVQSVRQVW